MTISGVTIFTLHLRATLGVVRVDSDGRLAFFCSLWLFCRILGSLLSSCILLFPKLYNLSASNSLSFRNYMHINFGRLLTLIFRSYVLGLNVRGISMTQSSLCYT